MHPKKEISQRETFHYPVLLLKQWENDVDAGKKIFYTFCASCHAKQPMIPLNAPRIGDKSAWHLREKKGMKTLLAITIQGIGAMPARGGCFECSDKELR